MHVKCLKYMINQSRHLLLFFLLILCSCAKKNSVEYDPPREGQTKAEIITTYCTKEDQKKQKSTKFEFGDIICPKHKLVVSKDEYLKIEFIVTNEKSEDLYEYGYQVLKRFRKNKLIETIKLRKDEDAYWSDTPFVRIRKQRYLADLDGDGSLEFAIYPFSSGSAIFGTLRIFSLKQKIQFWGLARYQIEGDGHALLDCDGCSKFNLDACKRCR